MSDIYYIGVDVGTGSVRAAMVSSVGKVICKAAKEFTTWSPQHDYYEQSSDEIWSACVTAVREVLDTTKHIALSKILGIGFDATCSLVVLDEQFKPVSVSPTENDSQNVIVWMDHRAEDEAALINKSKSHVLDYVGGKISVEMQVPKLLWLKKNKLNTAWKRAKHFFDLPDFLTFKATGDLTRSLCSVVCKWTYINSNDTELTSIKKGWDSSFFSTIGLEDLCDDNFAKIGNKISPPGEFIGGLSESAAKELGLLAGTAVGASIIDAHAGGVGVLGVTTPDQYIISNTLISQRLALICGTSSCHMAVSESPQFVPGVWGPYYSGMIPELWLSEGGQSATGKLIDHVIAMHAAFPELKEMAKLRNVLPTQILNEKLSELALGEKKPLAKLTDKFHILPYFHGNRSPIANSSLRGIISGLSLAETVDDLAVVYLATVQAIAYGSHHIIQTMNENGHKINTLVICGGLSKNPVFVSQHADITGCSIILPKEEESILVGAAILGACASKIFASVMSAMSGMCGKGQIITPDTSEGQPEYHARKYAVFRKMYSDFLSYEEIMNGNAKSS